MAPTDLPPNDEHQNGAAGLPEPLKLSDAERIAADRLSSATKGSLMDALAIAAPDDGADLPVSNGDAGPALAATGGQQADAAAGASANGGGAVAPFTSALDAAAKLAADANAAAEALESLRRMLEEQLPGVAASAAQGVASSTEPSMVAGQAAAVPPPLPDRPPTDSGGLSRLVPEASQPRPQAQPSPRPVPPPARRLSVEHKNLDVRGFLAGVALSCAFGVVLYLFMSAG
jgi:hypothetical protein